MAGADRAPAEQRPQLELDAGREAEGPLRPDENLREIVHRRVGRERIQIVAADAALHFGKSRRDLVGFAHADGEQILRKRPQRRVRRHVAQSRADRSEVRRRAVSEERIDRHHVVAGHAIAQRARAAGIVARHAAEGRARRRRDVDRKPQPMRLELTVEIVEHNARLDDASPARNIEIEDAVEVFRAVDHQRMIDGLSALRRSAAPRQHRHVFLARQGDRGFGFGHRARRHHADRHHLIMRRVSGITAAGEPVEPDVAGNFGPQTALQAGRQCRNHRSDFLPGSAPIALD